MLLPHHQAKPPPQSSDDVASPRRKSNRHESRKWCRVMRRSDEWFNRCLLVSEGRWNTLPRSFCRYETLEKYQWNFAQKSGKMAENSWKSYENKKKTQMFPNFSRFYYENHRKSWFSAEIHWKSVLVCRFTEASGRIYADVLKFAGNSCIHTS